MKKIEIYWSGHESTHDILETVDSLTDTVVITGCNPKYISSLLRTLLLLRREQPLAIQMSDDIWEVANATGFESELR